MPQIKVTGKVSDFKKNEKNVVEKHSNFFLTINTNQRYKPDDPNLQSDTDIFVNVIEDVLNHINEYITLPQGVEWNDDNIKDVSCDYVIEVGGKKNCLHSHIFVKITHNTNVKLNYAKLKEKVCSTLGLPNIHFKNSMVRSNDTNILDYINKYTSSS